MPSAAAVMPPVDPPFEVVRPGVQTAPVVFASPHSGNNYPRSFVAAARLDPVALRRSEDAFVDELFAAAPGLGAPLLRALFPRAYVDPNREPWELDPAMFAEPLPDFVNDRSPRVGAGLGTIARVVASGAEIYKGKLFFADAQARIDGLYKPYHAQLKDLLDQTAAKFGHAVLIDCHSMPSIGGPMDRDPGRRRVDFVLGDCFGAACAPALMEFAETYLRGRGQTIARNEPYAGGFTTRHYGRPTDKRHALQIEINRALYMDERRIAKNQHFAALADVLTGLIGALGTFCRNELKAA